MRRLFKGGNNLREETIQGRKLFAKIRYIKTGYLKNRQKYIQDF